MISVPTSEALWLDESIPAERKNFMSYHSTMNYPDIDIDILTEWQEITNLISNICHIPSVLVMRQNQKTMEVISGSQHSDSPYKAHETAQLNGELFCETVVKTQQPLYVPNALEDSDWDHNPDLDLGMISYYGIPVNWPDGAHFGTFCILDRMEMHVTDDQKSLIKRFGRALECSLELIISNQELKIRNKELERLSFKDGLTDIANRRLFDQMLDREWNIAQRGHQPLSLILIDIDYFKKYNDDYGHQQGDDCLKRVAQALSRVVKRAVDLVGRYGGEEFVLLLPDTDTEHAIRLAENCRNIIFEQHIPYESSKICDVVTISVGVSTIIPSTGTQPSSLVDAADKLLYRAKKNGRNRVENA